MAEERRVWVGNFRQQLKVFGEMARDVEEEIRQRCLRVKEER